MSNVEAGIFIFNKCSNGNWYVPQSPWINSWRERKYLTAILRNRCDCSQIGNLWMVLRGIVDWQRVTRTFPIQLKDEMTKETRSRNVVHDKLKRAVTSPDESPKSFHEIRCHHQLSLPNINLLKWHMTTDLQRVTPRNTSQRLKPFKVFDHDRTVFLIFLNREP